METSARSSPANFISRFWAFITHKIHRKIVKLAPMKDPVLPPDAVTMESLIDTLDPEGLGKLDGQRNDPPPGNGRQGTGEHRIIVRICDLRQEWEEHANFWIRKHNDDIRGIVAGGQTAGIDSLLATAKQELENIAQNAHRRSAEIEKQVSDSQKREVAEQKRYGCEGEPEKGKDFTTHLIYVIALLAVETIANGYFLGIRSTGLLEGLTLAFLVSFLNGGIGFTMAYMCKSLIHEVGILRKTFGSLILCIGFAFLAFINLLVGHIRDRLSELDLDPTIASSGSATIDAVEKVFDLDPMLDGQSYFMAGFGALIAVLAIIAGWAAQSPHPQYLRAFERHRERREELLREKRRFDVEYSNQFKQSLREFKLAEEMAALQNRPREALYFDKAVNVRAEAVARIRDLESVGERILDLYRSANEKERGNETRDVHWKNTEWPLLSIVEVIEPPVSPEVREEGELEATCKEATDDLEQHYKKLKEKFPW